MSIDLESLAALDAVVRHGDFGRAAQHLHKVQSAVSYQVRKLEEQLGLALLDREGYRARLTPAGEALLAEGRRLLGHADRFEALARQFIDGWEPRLLLVADELARGELVEVRYRGGSRYRFTPVLVQRLDKPLGRAGRRLAELLRAGARQEEAGGRLG